MCSQFAESASVLTTPICDCDFHVPCFFLYLSLQIILKKGLLLRSLPAPSDLPLQFEKESLFAEKEDNGKF